MKKISTTFTSKSKERLRRKLIKGKLKKRGNTEICMRVMHILKRILRNGRSLNSLLSINKCMMNSWRQDIIEPSINTQAPPQANRTMKTIQSIEWVDLVAELIQMKENLKPLSNHSHTLRVHKIQMIQIYKGTQRDPIQTDAAMHCDTIRKSWHSLLALDSGIRSSTTTTMRFFCKKEKWLILLVE